MSHSCLPTPETTFNLRARIYGNGWQVDCRDKSNIFSMLLRNDFPLLKPKFLYSIGYYTHVGLVRALHSK